MPTHFDPHVHHRRSIRLKGYDYSQGGAYFVTMVTFHRACLFGEVVNGEMRLNEAGKIADECWQAIPGHFPCVELITHVIMPNHVHGVFYIQDVAKNQTAAIPPPSVGERHASPLPPHGVPRRSVGAIVGSYKSAVTKRIGRECGDAIGWQRNYYEHIVRNDREMDKIWWYIECNPVTWSTDEENPSVASSLAP